MEELVKALSPFPFAYGIAIGMIVAGVGVWAIRKGLQDSFKDRAEEGRTVRIKMTDEEKRLQWTAYEQIENIEKNSFESVTYLRTIAAALNRIADNRWNTHQ